MRFQKVHSSYFPFLLLIWLAAINEVLHFSLMKFGVNAVMVTNVFNLLESLLLLWQFKKWRLFQNDEKLYVVLQYLFVISWVVDLYFISGFRGYNICSQVLYAFTIVFMSENMINRLLIKVRKNLLMHPIFIICSGFFIFFTLLVVANIFWVFGLRSDAYFHFNIDYILLLTNLFCNLIYIVAILWMPRKQAFSLQY